MSVGEEVEWAIPYDLSLMVEASTGGYDLTQSAGDSVDDSGVNWTRLEELERIRGQTHLIVQRILFPIVVCFGCLGNSVTIVVLTRRWMKSSTNRYLTALAIYDTLYLIFALTMSFHHYPTISGQTVYVLYRAYLGRTLTNICSNTGIWLTVTFTVERFIVVCCPMKGKVWCTPARAKHTLVAVCLAATLVTLPEFFSRTVEAKLDPATNVTILTESLTEFGKRPVYLFGYQYANQALFTFLPLMLLSIFNSLLMRAVITAAKQRDLMTNSRTCYPSVNARSGSGSSQPPQDQHRITLMLICVVIVFITCQLPSAVAILYANFVRSSMTPEDLKIVLISNNVFNLLVMINSAVNFIFYSAFSSRFRATFRRVFCRRCMPSDASYSYPDVVSIHQGPAA